MSWMIRLASGRWYARLETDARGREYTFLSSADRPEETMRVPLPFGWRGMSQEQLDELARKPEVRIWHDEHGIRWRIAAVGPNTTYDFPFSGRYLVFDSEQAWAGLTRYDRDTELGDLGDEDLRALRDGISDFGGSRRSFRPPDGAAAV
jgi:hypothetical protein